MNKLSNTYKKLGIDFTFPIEIKNAEGNPTYFEDSFGYRWKREYNANGNPTYYENSDGTWRKREYDAKGNDTYYEDNDGYWWKHEYDAKGNQTYCETSNGYKEGTPRSQSYEGKIIEDIAQRYASAPILLNNQPTEPIKDLSIEIACLLDEPCEVTEQDLIKLQDLITKLDNQ